MKEILHFLIKFPENNFLFTMFFSILFTMFFSILTRLIAQTNNYQIIKSKLW